MNDGIQDNVGNTALMQIIWHVSNDCHKGEQFYNLLTTLADLEHGYQDNSGKTALMMAVHISLQEYIECSSQI